MVNVHIDEYESNIHSPLHSGPSPPTPEKSIWLFSYRMLLWNWCVRTYQGIFNESMRFCCSWVMRVELAKKKKKKWLKCSADARKGKVGLLILFYDLVSHHAQLSDSSMTSAYWFVRLWCEREEYFCPGAKATFGIFKAAWTRNQCCRVSEQDTHKELFMQAARIR